MLIIPLLQEKLLYSNHKYLAQIHMHKSQLQSCPRGSAVSMIGVGIPVIANYLIQRTIAQEIALLREGLDKADNGKYKT